MATELRAMTDGELAGFSRQVKAGVIADLTTAGYDEGEAAALADLQMSAAFPNDLSPPEHRVCHVVREGRPVGHVWYGPDLAAADGGWWLFEFEVDAAHRGSGIGVQVLALVEDEVRRMGGSTIGLRVFDHNEAARRLYERSGYRAISTLMRKDL